jgi:hypothetical protein
MSPTPTNRRVATLLVVAAAPLIAAVMLSNFVDALHLSMARGEALRAMQQVSPPVHVDAGMPVLIAELPRRGVDR